MRPAQFTKFLKTAIQHKRRVLVKGRPGIGKSDCVVNAAADLGTDVVLMHPAISDVTDFKGMPALTAGGSEAHFLPFGDLNRLIKATKTTVCFLDDIGQSPPAVQSGLMQLVLARSVNGAHLSEHVIFVGATNDTTHMAAVSGMIEPLKSRWDTIVELEINTDDWCDWANRNNMPPELIAFIRFRPALLSDFKPTKEITNSPCPRTWASCGHWINSGVRDLEVFEGAVGKGAATELFSFLDMYTSLPSLDDIIKSPKLIDVPEKPASCFAIAAGLARKATAQNLANVITYLDRMPVEFNVMCMKDVLTIGAAKGVTACKAFVDWSVKHQNVIW